MGGHEKTVALSERLRTLCGMVTPGKRVVDVGCDHGYADIFLVQQGISPGVIAMDVREGPLAGARAHVEACGLGDYIELRLSDGLEAYRTGEAQTLICAGMGGRLMRRILERDRDKAEAFHELILQPQSELSEFRAFLRAEGYLLLQEAVLVEEGKYYFPMRAVPGGRACEAEHDSHRKRFLGLCDRLREKGFFGREDGELEAIVTTLCDCFGMQLLWEQNEVLQSYLEAGLLKRQSIVLTLSGQESVRATERLQVLESEIGKYQQALALCGV